jgi:hypothetical protein
MEVGGAQRQVVNLMRTLDPTRFEQCLICLERKGVLGEGSSGMGSRFWRGKTGPGSSKDALDFGA